MPDGFLTARSSWYCVACRALVLLLVAMPVLAQTNRRHVARARYIPVTKYDPKRNAAQDIRNAIKEATRTRKYIILEIGGEWCGWCHRLDEFFKANPELERLRDRNFVTVKINFSEENNNQEVLSRYPPIGAYPHMFFLDSHGELVLSQDTGVMESGKGYDLERVTVILTNVRAKQ